MPHTESTARYKKQLRGWLSYAFASEVFVIVSLTLFLPICLEQFARDNGFLAPERTVACTSVSTNAEEVQGRCVVKIGWLWIDTASFSLYVYSLSVAFQALTVISMGSIADHPSHRKQLLLMFAFTGAAAATLFLILPSSSNLWLLSALLALFANVGFGASIVAMNAYLPSLAQCSPEVLLLLEKLQENPDSGADNVERSSNEAQREPLLAGDHTPVTDEATRTAKKEYDTALSNAVSRISSLGIALGYAAGILLLILALIPVTSLHGTTFSLRLAIGLSGIWWAVFSIPAAIWLPSGSMSRNPAWIDSTESAPDAESKDWKLRQQIVAAWRRLGGMLHWREIKRLQNTFRYLAAWFLLSDGFTTITSTAVLFGKTTLHMQPAALILVGILAPTSGIIGSLVWPFLQRRFQWTNLKVLIILVIMASLMPAYGCLGFLPALQGNGRFGGLTTQEELFVLAAYFGFVYGAFQSYARAFYAELLPPGEEARWYGLFSITDKSSSFIGPLVVGIIADSTGNIRYAFFFLVFMIWLAVPVLMSVNVEQGRADARAYRYHSEA
ncbi:MFS general substrate transporter [Athelia psychrophila]|uniref:Autophagy-related protein n=1 Tax=Athelia psychrophila TaxID=1759441 RepID=A0A166ME16_9AGAM|nr:MFS general substrate transporter [Fibularhizoctonia sp. CBS 109695]